MQAAYALKWKGMMNVRPLANACSLGILKLLVIALSFWR
jgi:hypothetical protein